MDPLSLIAGICVVLTGHAKFPVREAATVWLSRHGLERPVLPDSDKATLYLYRAGINSLPGQTDRDYSEATRLWLKDLMAEGRFRQAELLLEVLKDEHRAYCERNGLPVPP